MKWTDEKPSVPGFYWHRFAGCPANITRVYSAYDGTVLVMREGQWSGPIEVPEEPSTIETGIRPIEVMPVGLGNPFEPPTMVERKYLDPDIGDDDE